MAINNLVAIRLTNLERISNQYVEKKYVYQDLRLDIIRSGVFNKALNRNIEGNDVKVDYDEGAVKNSIINLFNTKPGQRFLFPLFGLDLTPFLFEAITDENGRAIGEKIVTTINKYEPRVIVQKCQIIPKPEQNEYEINLFLVVPIFNASLNINTFLDVKTKTFTFINTLNNT